jgi:hypothetical protein
MEQFFIAAAALACPLGMGAMMWFMGRGMRRSHGQQEAANTASLDDLRSEHERIGEQIERLERDRVRS